MGLIHETIANAENTHEAIAMCALCLGIGVNELMEELGL